jgi:hypothetical protein
MRANPHQCIESPSFPWWVSFECDSHLVPVTALQALVSTDQPRRDGSTSRSTITSQRRLRPADGVQRNASSPASVLPRPTTALPLEATLKAILLKSPPGRSATPYHRQSVRCDPGGFTTAHAPRGLAEHSQTDHAAFATPAKRLLAELIVIAIANNDAAICGNCLGGAGHAKGRYLAQSDELGCYQRHGLNPEANDDCYGQGRDPSSRCLAQGMFS